jgi:hypothetical protein
MFFILYIKLGKRKSIRNFLGKLDFRKDGAKANRFVSYLNNELAHQKQSPMQIGNKLPTNHSDIANTLCKAFANVSKIQTNKYVKKTLCKLPSPQCLDKEMIEICCKSFTKGEFERALSETKKKKAPGIDQNLPESIINLEMQLKR